MKNRFGLALFCSCWTLLLLLLIPTGGAQAARQPAEWGPVEEGRALASQVSYFRDPSKQLELSDVRALAEAKRFTPWHSENELHFGFDDASYWIRIPLQVRPSLAGPWVVEVLNMHLDALDMYVDGETPIFTGAQRHFSSRPRLHPHYVFPTLLDSTTKWAYLRVESQYALSVPIRILPETEFQLKWQQKSLLQYMYFGGMAALLLLNVCIYVTTRDRRFLYYLAYVGTFGMGIFAGNGFGRMFIWPEAPRFDQVAQSVFLSLATIAAIQFSRAFLATQLHLRHLDRGLCVLATLLAVNLGVLLAHLQGEAPINRANQVLFGLSLVVAAVILTACISVARQRWETVRVFLLSWQVLWLGVVVAVLRAFNILPSNSMTSYALQIASALEMILLAFAMADILRQEMRQREKTQMASLKLQEQIIELMAQSERTLEQQVSTRTSDLREALQREIQIKQQYVRFGSLIAHEFRNPLAVIMNQVEVARRELAAGKGYLEQRLSKIFLASEQLRRLFEQWLQSDRVLNGAYGPIYPVNIQVCHWMDDTLKLAHDKGLRCRYATDSVASPEAQGIAISGDRHLMDLAIWNLIENAEKYAPNGTWIELAVHVTASTTTVSVVDQGPGIEGHQIEHVFDEYYRADRESRQRGLGLGLAMVAKIMLMHRGRAGVDSQPGRGSRFWLEFPRTP